jgi:SPP1 family predicted phage head-tail adaptor
MLNPRELRHRVDIESRVSKQDPDTGDVSVKWQTLHAGVPARIAPLSVREFVASQSMQSSITAKITIRYHAGLTAGMRIVHNGKIYNPQGWLADLDSGVDYLTAPCTEGVNDG